MSKKDDAAERMTRWWAARGLNVETMTYLQWFIALRLLRLEILAKDACLNARELRMLQQLTEDLSQREIYARVEELQRAPLIEIGQLQDAFAWLAKFAKRFGASK